MSQKTPPQTPDTAARAKDAPSSKAASNTAATSADAQNWTHVVTLRALPKNRDHSFEITPDAAQSAQIARELDILGARKIRFAGTLSPVGRSDWRLLGTIGATVTQPCGVTLAPVTTRIDESLERNYLAELREDPEADTPEEIEIPEDDTAEALPATLDLAAVAIEALALALPPFPRAPDADLGEAVFTEPGKDAMTDEATKPFAGLASLRDKLADKE
ncbi:hypothetical protein AQS8620_03000 [Aquimixticola soesokkakensis]|uniref:DUF177 domain-containing protein n=1 Tax=Aquimixticola soesokkakensis TaxID=1519096 RepID=A0A1Y5TIU2_9RHOB|nr:DUF177 domain-containing protein [Aquimixticola soesokkakensis]SLN65086.1 hypothetical protein AQS8620_03000 [Aquimixticola soesokkakensis]